MEWTVTYIVVIVRNPEGFTASCPAFPEHTVTASNRRAAYRAIKEAIRKELRNDLTQELPVQRDPVVSVKHLRVNMMDVRMEVGLG